VQRLAAQLGLRRAHLLLGMDDLRDVADRPGQPARLLAVDRLGMRMDPAQPARSQHDAVAQIERRVRTDRLERRRLDRSTIVRVHCVEVSDRRRPARRAAWMRQTSSDQIRSPVSGNHSKLPSCPTFSMSVGRAQPRGCAVRSRAARGRHAGSRRPSRRAPFRRRPGTRSGRRECACRPWRQPPSRAGRRARACRR